MRQHNLDKGRLFLKRTGIATAWLLLFLGAAVVANLVGIRMAGDVAAWERWLHRHSLWFLVWRLTLYAGIAAGWIWMRKRVLDREPDSTTGQRLRRLEVAAVAVFVVLEASLLLQRY
ncbi:hypothetical protein [Shinella sp.]|uniref:hypothetical protein n=1 Tax=Shinella sp. TaxID=1870904 RepID=UPI002588E801|nr:hypothetical protein [Shinella sp.]MCW5706962.1 hypothetical protein [Shinella sp.]